MERTTAKLLPKRDQYGYVEYPEFVRLLATYYVGTSVTLAEAVEKCHKEQRFKDGKIATDNWKALWLPNTSKNSKKPERRTRYMSTSALVDTISRPATFRDMIIAMSLKASVDKYKEGEPVFEGVVLPPESELAALCHKDIATNYNTSCEMVNWFYYRKSRPSGGDATENIMHAGDLPDELMIKRHLWICNTERIYKLHGVPMSTEKFIQHSNALAQTDFVFHGPRMVYKEISADLDNIRNALTELAGAGRVKLFYGGPGTGKTYNAIAMASFKNTLWSLSNTVAFSGAARIAKQGKKCTPLSFASVRARHATGGFIEKGTPDVLIDEMSQLGLGDLDILRFAIEYVKQTGGKIIMMGDINKIPSFLSRGSVLYSIIEEFPEICTLLEKNMRVDEGSRILADKASTFSKDGNCGHFSEFVSAPQQSWATDLDPETVIITGANTQTDAINCIKFINAIPGLRLAVDGTPIFSQLLAMENKASLDKFLSFIMRNEIICMPTETTKLPDIKLMRNEKYMCSYDGSRVVVVSQVVSGKSARLQVREFLKSFTPAYAINVNKAQGLEWDHVILCIGDLVAPNDTVKSNYLLRSSFEHLYVGATRARKSMSVFAGNIDLSKVKLMPVRKFNLFKEAI